jgi:hypothetical protein
MQLEGRLYESFLEVRQLHFSELHFFLWRNSATLAWVAQIFGFADYTHLKHTHPVGLL